MDDRVTMVAIQLLGAACDSTQLRRRAEQLCPVAVGYD